MVFAHQVHGRDVAVVTGADRGRGTLTVDDAPAADALVTATPGVGLAVMVGDCVPIVLYDPAAHVLAAVHAGWRGTVARVTDAALDAMAGLGGEPCPRARRARARHHGRPLPGGRRRGGRSPRLLRRRRRRHRPPRRHRPVDVRPVGGQPPPARGRGRRTRRTSRSAPSAPDRARRSSATAPRAPAAGSPPSPACTPGSLAGRMVSPTSDTGAAPPVAWRSATRATTSTPAPGRLTCRYSLDGRAFAEVVTFPTGDRVGRPGRRRRGPAGVPAGRRVVLQDRRPARGRAAAHAAAAGRARLPARRLPRRARASSPTATGSTCPTCASRPPTSRTRTGPPAPAPRRDPSAGKRPLVPFGGGIDSIVTVELVRPLADAALFVVSPARRPVRRHRAARGGHRAAGGAGRAGDRRRRCCGRPSSASSTATCR